MDKPKNQIKQLLAEAIEAIGMVPPAEIPLERPEIAKFGDYSSPVALQLFAAKPPELAEFNSPRALAEAIVGKLQKSDNVAAVTVAGPGFINFALSTSYLLETDSTPNPSNKAAIVEYMQPNTNKPLHVGHLRNAILGSCVINLLQATGWNVKRATVNNDRGLHITKSMWAYLMQGEKQPTANTWQAKLQTWMTQRQNWLQPEDMSDPKLHKSDFFVGYWYIEGDKSAEDTDVQKQWQEMLLAWENAADPQHEPVRTLWKHMNNWFYAGAQESYAALGVSFDPDQISYESDIYAAGKQIILDNVANGLFEKLPDGAVRANLQDKYNLPDKILLRRDGTGIYMTFDIELTRQRSQQHADLLMWVVGADQELYFRQLFAVCELLGFGTPDKFKHFSYGMVRLPEGKMSSRKGTVVYADDVIEAAIEKALEVMNQVGVAKDLDEAQRQRIAREVGIGAVKYTMLSYEPKSEIAFDIEKSVTFEGSSGPYLQYSHARACSVLRKAEGAAPQPETTPQPQESALIHKLAAYADAVEHAATNYAPNKLCTYLLELAQEFNSFYATCNPIVGNSYRQKITAKFAATLKQGLEILGIAAPEVM